MDEVEYSGLLKSEFFWSALDAEHGTALVFRPNSLLLRPGIEAFVERKHAYIGAPWPPGDPVYRGAAPLPASATPSGGGLSLRSVDAMLACVANFARESPSDEPEDVFFVRSLPSLRQLMPTLEETMEFAIAAPASIATGDTPLGMTDSAWTRLGEERVGGLLRALLDAHAAGRVADRTACAAPKAPVPKPQPKPRGRFKKGPA